MLYTIHYHFLPGLCSKTFNYQYNIALIGCLSNEVSTGSLEVWWSKVVLPLSFRLDEHFIVLLWTATWLQHIQSEWETVKPALYSSPVLCVQLIHTLSLSPEVSTGPLWQQRSVGLYHGEDDLEPHYSVGLEVCQKQTSASATVNCFNTRSTLLWKLNLSSQNDGVRGINSGRLWKPSCLTSFHQTACCNPGWWCGIENQIEPKESMGGTWEIKSRVMGWY